MKKNLILSLMLCVGSLTITDALAQAPARQAAPSSSRTQTTTVSSPENRQMRKGDAHLNKANNSYQKAQSAANSRNSAARTSSSNKSSTANRPSSTSSRNKTATPSRSTSAAARPATKPSTAATSSPGTSAVTDNTKKAGASARDNRAGSPVTANNSKGQTAGTVGGDRGPAPKATPTEDYSKRGYTSHGEARPQPAPEHHAGAHGNAPKPVPYVHPNHHNFGHHMHVPPRVRPVYYHGVPYYFYNSVFCRYLNGYYVICRPPIGAVIAYTVFNTWRPVIVIHNNTTYYYDDGTFYSPRNQDYVVVNPPIGARVAELPSNYEEIVLEGNVYFKVDNVYYKEVVVSGYLWYEVVFVS